MKYSIEITWSMIDDVLEYTLHISTTFCNQKRHFTCIFWTSFIKSSTLNKLCKKNFSWGQPFWELVNICTNTTANRSGVSAIDGFDRFEQVSDAQYIPQDLISMVRP